jgi:hypothetical protein
MNIIWQIIVFGVKGIAIMAAIGTILCVAGVLAVLWGNYAERRRNARNKANSGGIKHADK